MHCLMVAASPSLAILALTNVIAAQMLFSKPKKLLKEAKKKFSRQGHVRESSPGPSVLDGEIRGEESSLVQSGIGSLVPLVDSVADTSQGQLSSLQPSYPSSSSSAQTHDHQDSATLTGPTETHRTGNVVDPWKTQAIPDNATGHPQSTIKSVAGAAWNFTEMLLKKLPDAVDTNPAKAVLGAIRIILQIKDGVRSNIDSVDEQIRATAIQLDEVEKALNRWKYKENNSLETHALSQYQMTLNDECKKLIKLKKQSLTEQIAVHEENKGKIEGIFRRINQAREQLVRETGLRVQEIVVEIREDVAKLQKLLLAQLKPSEFADYKFEAEGEDQQTLRRVECTPGTRAHILEEITRWANDTSSTSQDVYWLFGQAGSGKSTLAYTIARHFEAALDADDNIVLGGNFFCSRQMKETRSATYIIRTIVYHLAHKWAAFAEALNRRNFDVINHSVRAQLQTLLIEPWEEAQQAEPSNSLRFLVVIDALDEITGQGGSNFLRGLFDAINKSHLRGLKFFATSRPDRGLVDHVGSFPNKQFYHLAEVPMEEAEADIATYLNAELPKFKDTQVMKKLVEQAAGLFIYAATVVKYLENLLPSEQRERIDKLPPSGIPQSQTEAPMLDNLYLQVLHDAFRQYKGIGFNRRLSVLHTILCSGELISTNIIAELLFPAGEADFRDIVGPVLKGLHAVLYIKNDKVLLYHKSFIDFMFDQSRATMEFWCNPLDSQLHLRLATSCFYTMDSLKFNIANIESSFIMDSDNPSLSDSVKWNIQPILKYSCRNWEHHIVKTDSKELADTLSNFLKLPVLFWIEAMNLLNSCNMCERMLRNAHNWITNDNPSLGEDLSEAASFALHFSGSGAALSTPHLYISALATWRPNSGFSWGWKDHFIGIPNFVHGFGGRTLMTIPVQSRVFAIACSSDDKQIVSGSENGTVQVWDASTGVELKKLEGHSNWVRSVAFSSDNKYIVSGSDDKTVRVWDVSMGVELKKLEGHTNSVESVTFSSNGKHIVSGSYDETVRVWDASMGVELKKLKGHSNWVQSVAFSRDNRHIVSGSYDKTVRIWDASTGVELKKLEGHTSSVRSVAFSSNNKHIVSGSDDKTVRVWDASMGVELKKLDGHTDSVQSVAFSSNSKHIVSGSDDKTVRVWDTSAGEVLKKLEGHTDSVQSVVFLSNSKHIVSGSDDKTVRVWDTSAGEVLKKLEGHSDWVRSVAFSRDNRHIVSGSYDKTVQIWDALTGVELKKLEGHTSSVESVAFSSDNKHIVSGSYDKTVRVWDASTGLELKKLEGHSYSVNSVAFSSDNKLIVSGSYDKAVRIWDALTGVELKKLEGHTSRVESVAFSSDNKHIVSGSYDKTVRVWDASTGLELKKLEGHTGSIHSVAFSSDNKYIVSGSGDKTVRIWDALMDVELKKLEGHTGGIQSIALSSDNKYIVSGSGDRTVRVWDASMGVELKKLEGHHNFIMSVAFSSDNKHIVSGSDDETVRVWDTLMGDEPRRLEGHHDCVQSVGPAFPGSGDQTVQVLASPQQYSFNRYLRQKIGQHHTGWLLSPEDAQSYLMFVPLSANLPDAANILTIPQSSTTSVDFTSSTLGCEWTKCYSPK